MQNKLHKWTRTFNLKRKLHIFLNYYYYYYYYYYLLNFLLLSFSWETFTFPGMCSQQDWGRWSYL